MFIHIHTHYVYIYIKILIIMCACLYIHMSMCTSAPECMYGAVSRCLRRLDESVKFPELELTGSG